MIVETIFSTIDKNGKPNFAPMGISWGDVFLTVRPYRNTRTCRNLLSSGYGVANITDDVIAFVQTALGNVELPHFPAEKIPGVVYEDACLWRELEVVDRDGRDDRAELRCRVLHAGRRRDFLGFRRAGSAVIEAAILATRVDLYGRKAVSEKLPQYSEIVEKTGGEKEREAMRLVRQYIQRGSDD